MKTIFIFTFLFLAACAGARPPKGSAGQPVESAMVAQRMILKDPPLLGTTPAGQRIYLGGFSGLRYLGKSKGGLLRFLALTDRGPNGQPIEEDGKTLRPFLLPSFQPRILFLEGDPAKGTLRLEKEIPLRRPDGKKLTGIPPSGHQENPLDSTGKPVPADPYGLDLEGIVQANGSFWLVDEYGPNVVRFSPDGKMMEVLKPGAGLPKVIAQRRMNRGFEGAAVLGNRLYAVLQSPLENPKGEVADTSVVVRLVEVDLLGRRTLGQYVYLLDAPTNKIGDLAVVGPRTLLAVEQDGKSGPSSVKRIYQIDLDAATNLQLLPERVGGAGGALEGLKPYELEEAKINPAKKVKFLDLTALGIHEEKVEGVDFVDDDTLAVAVDNDFGLEGSLDRGNGRAEFKDEPSSIYLLRSPVWVPAK